MATIQAIIQDAVQSVMLVDRDNIPNEIRDLCLSVINTEGRIIFDAWPWDNAKIDEFDIPASDADGIVTFAATVGEIRAIRAVSSGTQSADPVFAQDEVLAAINGNTVDTARFIYLSDDSSGNRRIRLSAACDAGDYKVLALKRCPVYSALDSDDDGYDATVDYSLVGFVVDRAEPALRAFVEDAIRRYLGYPQMNRGAGLLQVAISRESKQQQKEHRVNPRYPMFSEDSTWRDG